MNPPSRFAQRCEWALIPKHPSPGPLAFAIAQTLAQTHWCLVCLENLYLGGRSQTPSARHVRGTPVASPPPKPPKTIEKSMIRALEPPGTSPERSGTAQDHLKACSSHPSASQDSPVRPPRHPVRPPRRYVVRPGSSSVCPGSNSVCPKNRKFIEIPLEK